MFNLSLKQSYRSGTNSFDETIEYISGQFDRQIDGDSERKALFYVHYTNATDTENIDRVFSSCMDTAFRGNLQSAGFI